MAAWYTEIHPHAAITSMEIVGQDCHEMGRTGTTIDYLQKVENFKTSGSEKPQKPLGTNVHLVITKIVDHMLHINKSMLC